MHEILQLPSIYSWNFIAHETKSPKLRQIGALIGTFETMSLVICYYCCQVKYRCLSEVSELIKHCLWHWLLLLPGKISLFIRKSHVKYFTPEFFYHMLHLGVLWITKWHMFIIPLFMIAIINGDQFKMPWTLCNLGPLLLTWFNFNLSMYK